MNFIKSIFRSSKPPTLQLSEGFRASVTIIIEKMKNADGMLDDDGYYDLICQNTLNTIEANEIYIFLPIVFTQLLIPIDWPDEYIERQRNGKETTKKFSNTASFVLLMEVAEGYLKDNPCKDTVLNIAGRGAEFDAVNQLLLEGGKVEDIKATKTMIIR